MTFLKYLLSALVAIIALEVYLNFTVLNTLGKEDWFEGTIHVPDEKYGFLFKPNYSGYMRHNDKVFLKELKLDDLGMREGFHAKENEIDICFIGGVSMMFGFGAETKNTVQYQTAENLDFTVNTYNIAYPGFDLYRSFHIYKDKLEPKISTDVVIFSLFGMSNATIPSSSLDSFDIPPIPENELFKFSDEKVLKPNGPVGKSLGGLLYDKSIIGRWLADKVDSKIPKVEKKLRSILNAKKQKSQKQEDLKSFENFVSYTNAYFKERDVKVLYLFLPCESCQPEYYEALYPMFDELEYLDLNKVITEDLSYIANGHYSENTNLKMSLLIAEYLKEKQLISE